MSECVYKLSYQPALYFKIFFGWVSMTIFMGDTPSFQSHKYSYGKPPGFAFENYIVSHKKCYVAFGYNAGVSRAIVNVLYQ